MFNTRHSIDCPPRSSATPHARTAACLAIVACFAATPAAAQTWDGNGTTNNWSLLGNWNPNGVPANGSDLIFGGVNRLSNTNDALTSVSSITFASGGGAFNLGGNGLGLTGSVTNNSVLLQTINLPLTLLAPTTSFAAGFGGLSLGAVNLGAFTLWSSGGSGATTITGAVTGSGGVNVTGGTLVLSSGANTYSGGTEVQNGTLSIAADASLGTGTLTLGTALLINHRGTLRATANVTTARDIVLAGANGGGGMLYGSGGGTLTVNGVISGVGPLAILGTVVLGGVNTYTGATTFDSQGNSTLRFLDNASARGSTVTVNSGSGTLVIDANAAIGALAGSGAVTLGAGTFTAGVNNAGTTYSGVMSGAGSFVKAGSGTMTLSGANTYSGGTSINGGTLSISSNANLGAAAGSLSFDGGRLRVTDVVSMNRAMTIAAGGGTIEVTTGDTLGSSGALSGSGALTKSGAGLLNLSGSYAGYTGATTITAGSVGLSGDVLRGSTVTVNAGTTLTSTAASSIGGLAGGGSVILSGAALTAGTNGSSTTFSGTLSGSGSLVKDGGGALTLSGANTYTGATTVAAGTLNVTGTLAGTSGFNVQSGATLASNGFITGSVNAQAGSTIAVQPGGVLVLSNINGNSVGNLNVRNGVMVLQSNAAVSGVASVDGGTLIANGLNLGASGSIAGHGTVVAAIAGGAGATINAAGPSLTLGNASSAGAISSYAGTLNVGASRVALLEGERFSGAATLLQGNVTIAGGVLSAPLGIELNSALGGGTLSGYGTIQDRFINQGLVTGGSGANVLTFAGAVSGAGSFLGNVTFAGSYSPGNSPASVVLGNAHFGALDRLTMELGGSVLGTGYDHLTFLEGGVFGGTLDVVLIDGFTVSAGNSFDLFDGPLSGTFSAINLPTLGEGLSWDISALYTTGDLRVGSVAAVPEPETYVMLLAGLGLLGFVARRRAKWGRAKWGQNNIS